MTLVDVCDSFSIEQIDMRACITQTDHTRRFFFKRKRGVRMSLATIDHASSRGRSICSYNSYRRWMMANSSYLFCQGRRAHVFVCLSYHRPRRLKRTEHLFPQELLPMDDDQMLLSIPPREAPKYFLILSTATLAVSRHFLSPTVPSLWQRGGS